MVNRITMLVVLFMNICACVSRPVSLHEPETPASLTIYDDGRMLFRDRIISREDVVIYPDGFGGERAAIKMHVPAKPDYYRDSIRVDRIRAGSDLMPEHEQGELN